MAYCFLVLLIFISLLIKGAAGYYDFIKTDLYVFLIPFIILKIIINVKRNQIVINKSVFYFFLYVFSIFFSLLINNMYETNTFEFFRSIKSTFSFISWPLIYLLAATEELSKKESIRFNKLLWTIGYITAANTVIPAVIYFLTGNIIGEFIINNGSIRSFGFLTDQVGFALVYFVVLSVYEKKYLSALFFLISILVTGTRGAIVFAIMALIVVFVFQKQKNISSQKIFYVVKRGSIIFLFLAIAWFSFGDKISNMIALRIDDESIENTSLQRLGAMESGLALFYESPFFGVGFGKFSELVYNDSQLSNKFTFDMMLTKEENMRGYANPQNEFINILVNGGIFSLIIVTLFIYNVLKNIRAKIKVMNNPDHQIVAFIFIILAVFLIQTSVYIFNSGIISLITLILLGRGSSKSLY